MPKKTVIKAQILPVLDTISDENRMKLCMKSGGDVSNSVSNFEEVDKEFGLTDREIAFCQVYYTPGITFGKHIPVYSQVFCQTNKDLANREGLKLLRKKNVKALLADILSIYRDRELAKLIIQDKSLIAKLGAIKLSYEVAGDIKQSVEHIHTHTHNLKKLSDKELDAYIEMNDKLLQNG